jgi:hypothetical protein
MAEPRRQLPAWLVGFILAVVIFVVTLLVLDAFGYGDDPVIEGGLFLVFH